MQASPETQKVSFYHLYFKGLILYDITLLQIETLQLRFHEDNLRGVTTSYGKLKFKKFVKCQCEFVNQKFVKCQWDSTLSYTRKTRNKLTS